MKLKLLSAALISVVLSAGTASVAVADEALAKKSGCLTCHSIDRKMVGPSFKDIAASDRDRDTMIHSVQKGSKGVYGKVMMPPNSPRISDENIGKLVDFILTHK
ncbi:MAG: c-type cytochrome [Gammaproteobacteria bacterium]|nr:c-type cytochrome [Gammaproteobacteria bacterium]MCF6230865.1 c-type cytochrome [Gammaproteobacteria bacterium]